MGLQDLPGMEDDDTSSESESDTSSQTESLEEITEKVRTSQFLKQFDPRTGAYRGPDPPGKDEVKKLNEDDWHDEWIEGEFYKIDNDLRKAVRCKCSNETWCGPRARFTRCNECHRVIIDKMWEDDRYENPRHKKQKSLEDLM